MESKRNYNVWGKNLRAQVNAQGIKSYICSTKVHREVR